MEATATFEFSPHALRRAWMERVEPRDVIAALEEEHGYRRKDGEVNEHFIRLGGETFTVIATVETGVILTLYRTVNDPRVKRDLQNLSHRTRAMEGIDRRRRRR
jgi:hypothetical protein